MGIGELIMGIKKLNKKKMNSANKERKSTSLFFPLPQSELKLLFDKFKPVEQNENNNTNADNNNNNNGSHQGNNDVSES